MIFICKSWSWGTTHKIGSGFYGYKHFNAFNFKKHTDNVPEYRVELRDAACLNKTLLVTICQASCLENAWLRACVCRILKLAWLTSHLKFLHQFLMLSRSWDVQLLFLLKFPFVCMSVLRKLLAVSWSKIHSKNILQQFVYFYINIAL